MENQITMTKQEIQNNKEMTMQEKIDAISAQVTLQFAKTRELWKDVPNSEFHEYVWNNYGPENDDWEFFTEAPITMDEVILAVDCYEMIVAPVLFGHNGYGDSIDREIVRDILFIKKGMRLPSEVEYARGLKKIFTPKGNGAVKTKALRKAIEFSK